MFKTEYIIKEYSSARSARVKRIVLAPPFLIYILFGINIFLQIPISYVIHNVSFGIGMLLAQFGAMLVPVIVMIRIFDLSGEEILPFRKIHPFVILPAAFMMLLIAVLADYLVYFTERIMPVAVTIEEKYRTLMHYTGAGSFVYKLAFLSFLPAFCEEVLFRGFCQTGLMRYYGNTLGVVITAAMFSVAHLNPYYSHIYFVLGLWLGYLFLKTGSLWVPITCHAVNNAWTYFSHAFGFTLPERDVFGWDDMAIISAVVVCLIIIFVRWQGKFRAGFGKNPAL